MRQQSESTDLSGRHRRGILVAASLAVAVVLIVGLTVNAWSGLHGGSSSDCGDIGASGPAAASSDEALAAWLGTPQAVNQPPMSKWRSNSSDENTASYRNTMMEGHDYREGGGYHSVRLTRGVGGWSVTGICV